MRMQHAVIILFIGALLASCVTYSDPDRMRTRDFSDYQSWYNVNKEPLAGPAGGLLRGRHLEDGGLREVYANEPARHVLEGSAPLPFPEGAVLLKDTFRTTRDGEQGRRWNITVMRKREAGYDPENNDWEYLTAGPTGFVRVQGTYPLCIDCHAAAAARDFVFTWPE